MSTDNFLVAEAELALNKARKAKAERTKSLGDPIQLPGKALAISVRGNEAWIAENTSVVRRLDLDSGKTLQLFKGHTGPVTSLAFCDKISGSGDGKILITGSWDQTIKLWDMDTKTLISSTDAHDDFVKALYVLPKLHLLISSGSDKAVRFWDISQPNKMRPLSSMGSITAHARPVECLDGKPTSDSSALLYTADTMGIIRLWNLTKELVSPPRWRSTMVEELGHHRTRINELYYGNDHLWTASSDDSVQLISTKGTTPQKPISSVLHPVGVRAILPLILADPDEPYLITGAGDVIRVYDVSSLSEPSLINEIDAHWHDVTAIRLWARNISGDDGTRIEPWVISTSLDGTIRKWKLSELLNPPSKDEHIKEPDPPVEEKDDFAMTEEEERELAELMDE
ncbi:WD40 repeat-like protein [Cyathus striatus]|nr:WD40 repeat-like protein [Cyathus striatus]